MKDVLNMACPKKLKASNNTSPGNRANSEELRDTVPHAPQPRWIKFNVVFAWSLNKGGKRQQHCGLVYRFTPPLSAFLWLPLADAHCSSLTWKQSHSCLSSRALTHFIAASFPSKHQPTASFCRLTPQQFVSFFSFSKRPFSWFGSERKSGLWN